MYTLNFPRNYREQILANLTDSQLRELHWTNLPRMVQSSVLMGDSTQAFKGLFTLHQEAPAHNRNTHGLKYHLGNLRKSEDKETDPPYIF